MADTTVLWHSLPSLVSLTLKLYPRTGGEPVNGDGDTMTEDADVPGLYKATVTEALSGIYTARIHAGADLIGSYLVDLRDDTAAYDLADPAIAVGATTLALDEFESVAGGGGGGQTVLNVSASVVPNGEVRTEPIVAYLDAGDTRTIVVVDEHGTPIDLSGDDLEFVVETADAQATDLFRKTTAGGGITIGGADNNLVTITYTADDVSTVGNYLFALRRTTAGATKGKVWAEGRFSVRRAARTDSP